MGPSPRNSRNLSRVAAAPYATRATRASTRNTSILIDSDLDMSDDEDVNSQMMPQLPKMREICTPEQKKLLQEFFIRTSGYPTKAQKAEISRRINKSERSVSIWLQNQRHPRDKKKTPQFVLERNQMLLKGNGKATVARKAKSKRDVSLTPSLDSNGDISETETAGSSAVAESTPARSTSTSLSPVSRTSILPSVLPIGDSLSTGVAASVLVADNGKTDEGTVKADPVQTLMKPNFSIELDTHVSSTKSSTPGPVRTTRSRVSLASRPYPIQSTATPSTKTSPIKVYTYWHNEVRLPNTNVNEETPVKYGGKMLRPSELEVASIVISPWNVPDRWMEATHKEARCLAC